MVNVVRYTHYKIYPLCKPLLLQGVRKRNSNFSVTRAEMTSIIKNKNEDWGKKMKFYMKTYEDLFGITKLAEMHDKVIEIQSSLQSIQEKRRKTQEEIFAVQKKLQEMQDLLHKTSMGDDAYISVVTQVRELLKEQKQLQDIFSLYDQTEREQQTALAMAINNSQDHEKTYREKNKYLSLITGAIGGILGLIGSSINNWHHRKDIKHFASAIADQVIDLKTSVEKLKLLVLNDLPRTISSPSEDFLITLKSHQDRLDNTIQSLLKDNSIERRPNYYNSNREENLEEVLNDFERNIASKFNSYLYVNSSLIASCTLLLTFFVLYMTRNS